MPIWVIFQNSVTYSESWSDPQNQLCYVLRSKINSLMIWQHNSTISRDANLSTILGVRPQTLPAMWTRLKCSSRIFGSEDQKKKVAACSKSTGLSNFKHRANDEADQA